MIKFCFSKVIPAWLKPGGPHGVQQGSQMCSATGLPFPSPAANIWLSTRSGYYSHDLLSSLPPPSPVCFPQWHLRGEKSPQTCLSLLQPSLSPFTSPLPALVPHFHYSQMLEGRSWQHWLLPLSFLYLDFFSLSMFRRVCTDPKALPSQLAMSEST